MTVAPSSIQPFGHNTWAKNCGLLCSVFAEGELGPHVTQCLVGPGPRPTSIPSDIVIDPAVWPRTWDDNWRLCPFGAGGSWAPRQHNVAWDEAYLHSKWLPKPSSFILMHLTVWPQYINVTDKTETDRQRSDSIGLNVNQQ